MSFFNVFGLRALSIAAAVAFGLGAAGGGYITHAVDQHKYDQLVIDHATAQAKAVAAAREDERKTAKLSSDNGQKAAVADQKIVYRTNTIIKEVPTHVTPQTDARVCVPVGLVRLLDAAALGIEPSDLVLPAGQSDDTCSAVKASDLARSVARNYGTARQNAEQLNQLIADIRERLRIANGEN